MDDDNNENIKFYFEKECYGKIFNGYNTEC